MSYADEIKFILLYFLLGPPLLKRDIMNLAKKNSHGKFSIFYRKPLSSWLEEAIILNIKTLWTTPTLKESVWPLASVRLIWLEWAIPWPPISLRSVSFMDVPPYIMLTKWCSSYNILVKICEKNVLVKYMINFT